MTFTPTDTSTYESVSAQTTLDVHRMPLTITAQDSTKVYGASLPPLAVAYSGFVNGDSATNLDVPPSLSATASAASGVGAYLITPAGASATNYTVTFIPGTLTIQPAPLTVQADDKTMSQGTAPPTLTVTYSGFVNGDTPSSLTLPPIATTAATATSPAGSYPITASGAAGSNYTIRYVNGTLTVTAKRLPTLTWTTPARVTYGTALGSLQLNAAANVPGALTYNPPLGTVLSAGLGRPLAVTFAPADTATYDGVSATVKIDVAPAPLTISAAAQTKPYGAPLPALTAAYSGFVNGEDAASLDTPPVLSTTATAASPVGLYPITVQGAADANYSLTVVPGSLTVTPVPLVISAENRSKEIGAPLPILTASFVGFVNGDNPANLDTPPVLSTTATAASALGSYPIVVNGAADANYAITFLPGVLNVVQLNAPPTLNPIADRGVGTNSLEQSVRLTGITSGGPNEFQTLTVIATASPTNVITLLGIGALSPQGEADLKFRASPGARLGQTAAVTVTVTDGALASNSVSRSFLVTVTDRGLSAIGGQSMPGLFLDLPILLNSSSGGEQSIQFSLSFDPTLLRFQQALPGLDVPNADILVNVLQASQGRVGVRITPPPSLAAGARELAKLRFLVPDDARPGSTVLEFVDAPVPREILGASALVLPTFFDTSTASITLGFEADLSPRPTGNTNGTIIVTDWVQVGRIAAFLDATENANEFRRADCAPRLAADQSLLLGDGKISIVDWVQAGRYAAGLDPATPCGGPFAAASTLANAAGPARPELKSIQPTFSDRRQVRLSPVVAPAGLVSWVPVEMECLGEENALGFSVQFDPDALHLGQVRLGESALDATLLVNRSAEGNGRIGIAIALPPGRSFAPGKRILVELALTPQTVPPDSVPGIAFGDRPVEREISDLLARPLPASFLVGEVRSGAPGELPSVIDRHDSAPIPMALTARWVDGTIHLRPTGSMGTRYRVEVSADLTRWTLVETGTLATPTSEVTDPASRGATARFYRARQEP